MLIRILILYFTQELATVFAGVSQQRLDRIEAVLIIRIRET